MKFVQNSTIWLFLAMEGNFFLCYSLVIKRLPSFFSCIEFCIDREASRFVSVLVNIVALSVQQIKANTCYSHWVSSTRWQNVVDCHFGICQDGEPCRCLSRKEILLDICQEGEACGCLSVKWTMFQVCQDKPCWMFIKNVNHVRCLSRWTMLDVCQDELLDVCQQHEPPCWIFVKKVEEKHVGIEP